MRKEHQALQHALDALSDGSGHGVWGPGVIGQKLWEANEALAAQAFDAASTTLFVNLGQSTMSKAGRAQFIAAMKKLAPVLLDILLTPEL